MVESSINSRMGKCSGMAPNCSCPAHVLLGGIELYASQLNELNPILKKLSIAMSVLDALSSSREPRLWASLAASYKTVICFD